MALTWASTSSAIVDTCRRFRPLVTTNASVIPRTPPTSSTTVSSAFLAEAARAAVVTQCLISSSVVSSLSLLPIEVLADDDGDVDDADRLATQDEPARAEGLANALRRVLLGSVVEHDLRLSVGEAVGVSTQYDAGSGGHHTSRDPWGSADGAGAIEHLHPHTGTGQCTGEK